MKKKLYLSFILSGVLCSIMSALITLLFASDFGFYAILASLLFSIILSCIPALIFYNIFLKSIRIFAAKKTAELALGEYESNIDFEYYNEFKPFVDMLKSQNELIKEQITTLKTERDTIKTITDNMKEGIVLLNPSFEILSFNKSALPLLNSQSVVLEKNHLIKLTADSPLFQGAKTALEGIGGDYIFQIPSRTFQIFSNPVRDDNKIFGIVIMSVDITQKQNAENARREFSANVSHELKTPLTSISGYAEMIKSGMVSTNDDIIKFSGIIYKEAARLIKLTSDIIRLSEIEGDLFPPENDTIDLNELFESVILTLALTADSRNVTIINDLKYPIVFVANRSLMEELVFNLCENAVKYNKDCGSVTLSASKNGNEIEISVSDTGIGIPTEHLERIFERFWRVDKSRSKSTGGTGLGLSIVKHIAEHYFGSVLAESIVGEGTTITVNIYISSPIGEPDY